MSKIIHVQTTIQTTFGLLDDDGNVIPQQPVTVNVSLFKPEAFVEAQKAIEKARDQATVNYEAETKGNGAEPLPKREKKS